MKQKISQLSNKGLTTPRNLRYHMRAVSTAVHPASAKQSNNVSRFIFSSPKNADGRPNFDSSRLNASKLNSTIIEDVGQSIKSFFTSKMFNKRRGSDHTTSDTGNILPQELQVHSVLNSPKKY